MPPPRSTTRNTADPLDRVTLVGIAADLADEVGWSKLTLSLVAKRVERHVTSLYAHVDSLEALRREVAMSATDELADQVWKAALARTREDALRAIETLLEDVDAEDRGAHSITVAASTPARSWRMGRGRASADAAR